MPTFIKIGGRGIVGTIDDPSKNNDGNSHDNQPLRSKRSQNIVKTATKLSRTKIQVKAKTPKLDPENNTTKS